MIGELLSLTSICLLLYALYKYITLNNEYFKQRNVKFIKPKFFFGNSFELFFYRMSIIEFTDKLYNSFSNEKYCGTFNFRQPVWLIRDPEIIKQLTIKDFEHFEDRQQFVNEDADPLFGNSLILLKGEKWRDMRATLSPAFTGSKMRQMFELVSECADDMVKQLIKMFAGKIAIELEMKEIFMKYTTDVIATCAFGIKVNSFENPDNEFYKIGSSIKSPPFIAMMKIMFIQLMPTITKLLKIQLFPEQFVNFFRSIVFDTMIERKKKNIIRPDMINILMHVRDGNLQSLKIDEKIVKTQDGFATVDESDIGKRNVSRKWTDDQLMAQCFLFFFAGFETSSTALLLTSYELCVNPDVQDKLYEEIKLIDDKLNGKRIDYENLQKMKYLDQVISEVLRMWPPASVTDRTCVKEYTYDGDEKLHIEKGQSITIPTRGIQHDAKYFPNPGKFDPERFSDENKHRILPGSYIPFGSGPRNCIGSRFALMEIKAIIYYLILNFSIEPNKNSQIPVKFKKVPFTLQTEKGLYFDFKLRNK